ncbi:hypothetical protein J7J62_07780 [bacterium]|nr:hypothetical protein [bacterium]
MEEKLKGLVKEEEMTLDEFLDIVKEQYREGSHISVFVSNPELGTFHFENFPHDIAVTYFDVLTALAILYKGVERNVDFQEFAEKTINHLSELLNDLMPVEIQ